MAEGAYFSGSRRALSGKLDEGGDERRDAGGFSGENRAGGELINRNLTSIFLLGYSSLVRQNQADVVLARTDDWL